MAVNEMAILSFRLWVRVAAKETDFSKVRFGDESKAAKVAAGCRELTGGY